MINRNEAWEREKRNSGLDFPSKSLGAWQQKRELSMLLNSYSPSSQLLKPEKGAMLNIGKSSISVKSLNPSVKKLQLVGLQLVS